MRVRGKVKSIIYNWRQVGSVVDRDGSDADSDQFEVGRNDVSEIIENEPQNGLEQWNYIVKRKDGSCFRVFNPNFIEYFKTT